MASLYENIKNLAGKTGTKTVPAIVDFFKDGGETVVDGAKGLFNGAKGTGTTIGKVAGKASDVAVGTAKKGDSILAGTLNNKYARGAILIVAAVSIYKWAKGKLTRNRQQTDIEIKNQQAGRIEAQTNQMVEEYSNPYAKTGHVDRYRAEQGHSAGRNC